MQFTIDPSIVAKYEKAKAGLLASWRPGTSAWLREQSVGRLMEMGIADEALDNAWRRAEFGVCTEAEFDMVLEKWAAVHEAAVKDFAMSEER